MGHWNPLFFRFATSYVSSLRLIKLLAPALPNQSKRLWCIAYLSGYRVANDRIEVVAVAHGPTTARILAITLNVFPWSRSEHTQSLGDKSCFLHPSLYAGQSGASLIARIEGPQLHWWGLSEHKEYLAASLSPLHLLLQPPYNVVFLNLTHWLSSRLGSLKRAGRPK
jgi:hypothetical protein